MKVAFFTEMGFEGKIPRNHPNMRTESAWMVALDADHYPLTQIPNTEYDLGIVITPKKSPENVDLTTIKRFCSKVGVMQEGPFWYFQDYDLPKQIMYFNNLMSADIIFAHNEVDVKYFQGLTDHEDIRLLSSLMIEDPIKNITPPKERSGVMIGGNFKSWYGGFDSFMLAKSITDDIYSPQMGRRTENEQELGINQLPYLEWDKWITELNKRKIGVHMMRTHAAGTFALNCSYLGIPCIGYKGLDTQRILHPHLSVDDGDLNSAREMLNRLDTDKDFYTLCSGRTKELYNQFYHESKFKI